MSQPASQPWPFRAPEPGRGRLWDAALQALAAGLAAADPASAVRDHLVVEGQDLRAGSATIDVSAVRRVFLVGAGKAAGGMVAAVEAALGSRLAAGVVATVRGGAPDGTATTFHEAGHPLPDPGSLVAARHMARLLETASADDLVICVLSGGASALLELPSGRIPLADLQATTGALLASGAPIGEVNAVRKHVSAVKGGGLARMAAPARVVTLVLSDVVGSPLDVVASGPTVPDPTTYADAAAVLTRYDLWGRVPAAVADHIRAGLAGHLPETAKEGDPAFARAVTVVVGDNRASVDASARRARDLGRTPLVLTTYLEGEAREAARVLCAVARECAAHGRPTAAPALLLAGGETSVALRRLGPAGGRNQEMALACALALDGMDGIAVAALATDGVDGMSDAAGAVVDGTTVARAHALGLKPRDALEAHESGPFFEALGDRIVTGPTGTNVNDLVAIAVGT